MKRAREPGPRPPGAELRRWRELSAHWPSLALATMAAGVVGMALAATGQLLLGRVLLALAAGLWLSQATLLGMQCWLAPTTLLATCRRPGALAAAAATAVLGTGLTELGATGLGAALLGLAAAALLLLAPSVLAAWSTPTSPSSFLLAVAFDAVSVLAAELATVTRSVWLLEAALLALLLGLGSYLFVLASFDPGQLKVGGGDQWVAGGALAIPALAAAQAADAARLIPWPALASDLALAAVGIWLLALLWLPPLLLGELRRPRWGVGSRRWATVFPLAMYAASAAAAGATWGVGAMVDFARFWAWVALLAWLLTAAGLGLHARSAWGPHPDPLR